MCGWTSNTTSTVVLIIGLLNTALVSSRRQRVGAAFLRHNLRVHLIFKKLLHDIVVVAVRTVSLEYVFSV